MLDENLPVGLMAPTLPPEGLLITAPWDLVHDSPFQYRKTHDEEKLQELTGNIIETGGIHQAILARRRFPNPLFPEYNPLDGFEIVAGHRRKICGMRAGLAGGPLVVKDLDDLQVRRIQLTENIQRLDVHPIEEAEGFQELIDQHGETADAIAETIKKSRSYVYGRLKLLVLCKEVRQACLAGEIDAESALLIARLRTDKFQQKALGYIKGKYIDMKDGGKKSYRQIRDLLNERFALNLKDAIFDTEAETLLPAAGSCVTCPKRSGNAPEFADVASAKKEHAYSRSHLGPDVCTDPDCFDAKKKAHLKLKAAELEAKGKVVIDGNKARQAIDAQGKLKDGFVPLADVRDALKQAKDKQIETLHIQDPRSGKVVQAVRRDDLVAAGVKRAAPKPKTSGDSDKWERERAARDKMAEEEAKVRKLVLHQVHAKLRATDRSLFDLQMLARSAIESMDYDGKDLLQELQGCETWQQLEDSIATLSAGDLACLMLDIALAYQVEPDGWDLQSGRAPATALFQAAEHYGVDVDQVRAEVTGKPKDPKPAAQAQPKTAKKRTNAAPAAAKGKAKKAPLKVFDDTAPVEPELSGQEQIDDAGVAGGSAAQVDAFEDMELEA
jgi:ParB/RepB/Spo0J family partition protein